MNSRPDLIAYALNESEKMVMQDQGTPQTESASHDKPAPAPDKKSFLAQRLVSLDVYRGLIMITLAFNGFGLAATARIHLK